MDELRDKCDGCLHKKICDVWGFATVDSEDEVSEMYDIWNNRKKNCEFREE